MALTKCKIPSADVKQPSEILVQSTVIRLFHPIEPETIFNKNGSLKLYFPEEFSTEQLNVNRPFKCNFPMLTAVGVINYSMQ